MMVDCFVFIRIMNHFTLTTAGSVASSVSLTYLAEPSPISTSSFTHCNAPLSRSIISAWVVMTAWASTCEGLRTEVRPYCKSHLALASSSVGLFDIGNSCGFEDGFGDCL